MKRSKELLGEIMREAGNVFTVNSASKVFNKPNNETAKVLARWAKQGWITRIKRGLYAVVPLDAINDKIVLEDTWVLVPKLYSPCYVGGWSAAEYWGLTEQIFNDVCVLTTKPQPKKSQKFHETCFILTKINSDLLFGVKQVWKQDKKIQISNPHKTILDMLYNPTLGGGIIHTIDCIKEYIKSDYCDFVKLAEYAKKINSGAVFKRLGFVAKCLLGKNHKVTELCRQNLTKGYAYLDPKLKDCYLVTRWNLFVPKKFKELK